jgi:hypothetical protein
VNSRDKRNEITDSIIIAGDASGANVQNVTGYRASAISRQERGQPDQDSIRELIERIRALVDEARPELASADEYDAALDAIADGVASPERNRFSIKGALGVLSGAAILVTGWSEAITALQQAISKL